MEQTERDGLGLHAADGHQSRAASDPVPDCDERAAPTSRWTSRRCPILLRAPSGGIHAMAAVVGSAAGIAISLAIFFNAPAESLLGRLFNLRSVQGVLPLAMIVMFSWGLALCLVRGLRVLQAERATSSNMAVDLRQDLVSVPLAELHEQLSASRLADASPLLSRTRIVLRQWLTKPSLQDSLSLLNQQAVAEGEQIQHAYGVVKTFVWALPVLGLIGTVIGIALAVGEFGELVGGNVEDVKIIKSSLVHVTAGLAFAFTTTLLGLLGALLLALPSSSLQAREERLVTKAETLMCDLVLPDLQRLFPERVDQIGIPDVDLFRETLTGVAQEAVRAAGTTANEVLQEARERFSEWHEQVAANVRQAAEHIAAAAAEIGSDLAKSSDEFLARLNLLRESTDKQVLGFREGLAQSDASAAVVAGKLDEAIARHRDLTKDTLALMEQLLASTKTLQDGQASVARSMEGMTQGELAETLAVVAQTMSEVSRKDEAVRRALETLSGSIERVAACQQSLEENLERMEAMGLTSAFGDLAQALQNVSQVLKGFQEPVVFQAVRASSVVPAKAESSSLREDSRDSEAISDGKVME